VYRDVAPRLYGFALRLSAGDRARADDLCQEAWLRALARPHAFAGRSLTRWLCGILVNCWREQCRDLAFEAEDAPAVQHHAGDAADSLWSELPLVSRAVAALPDGCRAVLVLHDIEGYTHDEIARMLSIASGTSKSQLSRARRRVAAALAPVIVDACDSGRRT